MICKICSNLSTKIFEAKLLRKYLISYYHCHTCGFLQTEEPFWLEEAYKESINISDTGVISRNIYFSKLVTILICFLFDKEAKFVDFAGGYGIFTRLMRDAGFDFYWHDPYTTNLTARGFEYKPAMGRVELITSFESFEHFANPIEEIEKMLLISNNILFSTEFLPNPVPNPAEWWYYSLEHGQHISFYRFETLMFIAKKYGLNFLSNGTNIHLFTLKKIRVPAFKMLLKLRRLGIAHLVRWHKSSKTLKDSINLRGINKE